MKRILSIMLVTMIMCVSMAAYADVITIDTETATKDELKNTIGKLQEALSFKLETGSEQFTFKNGYTISVLKTEKRDGKVTIHYMFSHQNDKPTNFDIQDTVFQNGIELDSEYSSADINSYGKKTLKNATVEVTKTYILLDDSPLTIYILPWFSREEPYIVEISIS